MNMGFTIIVLAFGIIGAIMLKTLLQKNRDIFGVGKAYLVTTVFCVTLAGFSGEGINWLMVIGGLAGSYALSVALTINFNPINWLEMCLVGFGWSFRLVLRIFGVALPILGEKAVRDYEEQQLEEQKRREQYEREEEIKTEAYRRFGVRGQLNSTGDRWRADEGSDWVKVTSDTDFIAI